MDAQADAPGAQNKDVTLTIKGRIARILLDRPSGRNALSLSVVNDLHEAVEQAGRAGQVRVVIVEAGGPAFCPGHDLKEMHAHRADADGGRSYYETLFNNCSRLMLAIRNSPKIFIAKVHAIATAGGCQLVAACDMAVASSDARFGVNGINAGLFCSTPMVALSRNTGRKKSLELLTTGHLMSAQDALANGLVNHVVEAAELEARTMEMAEAVAEKTPTVLALGKKAFYEQLEMPLDEAYAHTTKVIVDNMMLEDAREGICAFVEKRAPKWKD